MKISRLVELALFYNVRGLFSIPKTKEVAVSADFKTYNVKYTNIGTNHSVIVYVNDIVIDSGFTLHYENGTIQFTTALTSTDVVKVDYWYCPINIYDEGKDPRDDTFYYPAIAIYEDEGEGQAIELGSSAQERVMNWVIEVWCERGGERNDISDTLIEHFEESNIPIINFNDGFPTNRDGSKNIGFNPNNILTYAICDSINYSKDGSLDIGKTPKYVSRINLNLRVIPA